MPRGRGSTDKAGELEMGQNVTNVRHFFNVFKTLIDIEDMFSRHIPGGWGQHRQGRRVRDGV